MAWYAALLAQTALVFQRKTGHQVSFFSVSVDHGINRCTALVEHEHCDVGMTAVKLAKELILGERKQLREPFAAFRAFAHDRRLPRDTGAIFAAARLRDIPCNHLERFPISRNRSVGDVIRPNGLIMLGHGIRRHVLDGTFCLDKSGEFKNLLKSPEQRKSLLETLGVPLYPADRISIAGNQVFIIAVNGQITGVTGRTKSHSLRIEDLHDSLVDLVLKINRAVGLAPIVVALNTPDISTDLVPGDSGVVGFELAPNLENFERACPDLLVKTAEAIVEWLFPDSTNARMPVIAVTGTNGKTTTTRMISHVLAVAGRKPGFVCTDGIYLDGRKVSDDDNCTLKGHFSVLSSKAVDIAVLETHHYGIMVRGFGYRWCDIAVCLNVTEDHLGVGNVETIDQMAEIKKALPERARYGAVLNADDPYCLAMLRSMTAKKPCLVSMTSGFDELSQHVEAGLACFCVTEQVDGEEWVVIYDQGVRLPVIQVKQIPATFNGTARFNVSNAMHAIVACYLADTDVDQIANAIQLFQTGYETTPGRMNEFGGLPFRVIVDFAHNPDGLRRVAEFADNQDISGRKLVAFAGTATRPHSMLRNMGGALAGHFDFYFCKEHVPVRNKNVPGVAHLLQEGLLKNGVAKEQTVIRKHGRDVIFEIFDACKPGDLLMMLVGHVEMHQLPDYISEYTGKQGA
jgi:cyanophycin synthetase